MFINAIYSFILEAMFPTCCVTCGRLGTMICKVCESKLKLRSGQTCHVCMRESFKYPCHVDCKEYSYLDGVYYACEYDHRSREYIRCLKYKSEFNIAKRLAQIMSRYVPSEVCQFTYVPVSKSRLKTRGYNQAKLLALAIGEELNVPVCNLLSKDKDADSQVGYAREERIANMQGIFGFNETGEQDKYKPVVIIDDVMTTGATLEACAKQLKLIGFQTVYALVFARRF